MAFVGFRNSAVVRWLVAMAAMVSWHAPGRPAGAAGEEPRTVQHRLTDAQGVYHVDADTVARPVTLRVENVGPSPLRGLRLVSGGRDWSSIDALLGEIVTPGMTDEQKARAIWQFARDYSDHWGAVSQLESESPDPVRFFNYYGYGLCSDVAEATGALYERAGLPARVWYLGSPHQHVVTEVFFDEAWHLLDADLDGLYLRRDNTTIAGVLDVIADPALVARAGAHHVSLVSLYETTSPLSRWPVPLPSPAGSHEVAYDLDPGERLTLFYEGLGRVRHDADVPLEGLPPLHGNAERRARIGAGDAWALSNFDRVTGIAPVAGPGGPVLAPQAGSSGELAYVVTSTYPVLGATLTLDLVRASAADRIEVLATPYVDEVVFSPRHLGYGTFRVPGLVVGESNLATALEDGTLPWLHAARGREPAFLLFDLTPDLGTPGPLALDMNLFRATPSDVIRVSSSTDGVEWTPVWEASSGQTGYFAATLDLWPHVAEGQPLLVRLELDAAIDGVGWTAGASRLTIQGRLANLPRAVWSTTTDPRTGRFRVDVPLDEIIAPQRDTASYAYRLTIRMASQTPSPTGVEALELTTISQVAPRALPQVLPGRNEVAYRHASDGPVDLLVTHEWVETGRLPPLPPAAPRFAYGDDILDVTRPFSLAWTPARAADGGPVADYQVRVCADATCGSPLGSPFDRWSETPDLAIDAHDWLEPGRTYFWRVRARDAGGLWSPSSEVWTFRAHDGEPVRLTLTTTLPSTVTSPFVSLAGQATSGEAILEVRWTSSSGAAGLADLDGGWTLRDVPLVRGVNEITITAVDARNRHGQITVTVTVDRFEYLLAEGAVGGVFTTEVALANPTADPAPVTVEFMPESGALVTRQLVVPPWSRRTVRVNDVAGLHDTGVSSRVISHDAVPLLVERTMRWDAAGHAGHTETAVTDPSTTWYFAEGAQGFFDTYVLVVNPAPADTDVRVRFLREGEEAVETVRRLGPRQRLTIYAGEFPELAFRSFAMAIDATQPVVVERAMYWSTADRWWAGGHGAAGTPTLSRQWLFAEGATGHFFDAWLLVGNPNAVPARVTFTYLLPDGRSVVDEETVPPERRLTRLVSQLHPWLADASFAVTVTADQPVVAERAMYWPGAATGWREGHSASGVIASRTRWGLGEGRVGGSAGFETFVLIANPDPHRAAEVDIQFLGETGLVAVRTLTVGPGRRETVHVAPDVRLSQVPELTDTTFGVVVQSGNGVPVVVERALYWNALGVPWSGGTSANGIPLP